MDPASGPWPSRLMPVMPGDQILQHRHQVMARLVGAEPAFGLAVAQPGIGHRPAGKAALRDRLEAQHRHVAVAQVALDPLEDGLHRAQRTFEDLGEIHLGEQ